VIHCGRWRENARNEGDEMINILPDGSAAAAHAAHTSVKTGSASAISLNPDALLDRKRTANALTEAGYPTSSATLATKASRGGGPPYQLYGRIPLYRWGNSLAWAQSRLSDPVRNTSESQIVSRELSNAGKAA
jgi:hypothetical protein